LGFSRHDHLQLPRGLTSTSADTPSLLRYHGREATLSIPEPDLVITNSTGNPVLIWPTYDDTSITVTLYSTKTVEVEELEQRVTRRRLCTHSEIDRQRTYSDGRVLVDTIVADYRPADGVDCNGRRIPQP
jgi:hypothetical protein